MLVEDESLSSNQIPGFADDTLKEAFIEFIQNNFSHLDNAVTAPIEYLESKFLFIIEILGHAAKRRKGASQLRFHLGESFVGQHLITQISVNRECYAFRYRTQAERYDRS